MQSSTNRHCGGPEARLGRRLVGYIRVSTDEQAATGLSLAAQRTRIEAFATAYGDQLVEVEEDHVSGKLGPDRRAGLARALAAVSAGRADGLVVFKLDRLSRKTTDVLQLAEDAQRRRWHLLSVCEHLDTSTAAGQFALTLFAALAEMERRQIGERTTVGLAEVARQGRARSFRLPFGFRAAGAPDDVVLTEGGSRRLVPHAGEQQVLSEILRLADEGLGGHAIASRFRAQGITNPRTGRPWSVSGLRSVIRTAQKRRELTGESLRASR